MGKNSRQKKKAESEGSSSTQQSQQSTSSSVGQPAQANISRQQLQARAQQQNQPQAQQSQRQPQQQQSQQQQQQQQLLQGQGQGRGQGPQPQQQSQQPAWGPKQDKPQGQGCGRGQLFQQPQQKQSQQQQQQQQRPQGQGRGPQPQQQSQQPAWGPKQDKPQGQERPQQQQSWRDQPREVQQSQDRPQGRGRGQQPQRSEPGLSRAESVQSVHSEKSASSSGSKGQRPNQEEKIPASMLKNLEMLSIVPYKGPGTRGRKLGEIETNYLKLFVDKMAEFAYHYDVTIEPDRPKKLLTRVFLRFVEINFPKESIAYDGAKSAYASRVLDENKSIEREITIIHPETGSEKKYIVSIKTARNSQIPIRKLLTGYKNTQQRNDDDLMKRAMQAMEVILKAAFHQNRLLNTGIQGGRSFFLPKQNRPYLGDSYELWLGLFQSLVLGNVPYLNVDVNHKAFPKRYRSLIFLLEDMAQDMRTQINPNRPLERGVEQALGRHLSGLELCYNVPGSEKKMIYKFMALCKSPRNERFRQENGQETTIFDYFRSTNRRIQYEELPCIKLGNSIKNIIVPMEFCSIPDTQVINKKCTENQTRNIIKLAATSTDERKNKIMELLRQITHNQSPIIRGFGLQVDGDFAKVPARQLEPPTLSYGSNKTLKPSRGVWRGENMQFLMPKNGIELAILNTSVRTRHNELEELAKMLYNCSRSTGLELKQRPADIITIGDRDMDRIQKFMEKVGQNQNIHILFVVIPDSGPTYAAIKQAAEINYGVLTQCIKGGTVFRKRNDGSTISNILLKVNAKLNGTNHKLQSSPILSASPGKVMVIGADVTHPSPEQKSIPSVVGVAASHDNNAFCYNMCWRLQDPKVEIIHDFKEICKEHLKFFKEKNGAYPEKILYYRDGVSEGQFDQVMAIEKNAMIAASRELQQGYEKSVQLTVVVVQKRHHTRFFPGKTNVGSEDKKNNNVPAGTIVDQVIIRPKENHFYLVSHQSIQGVAKPTKYCILLDDGNHNIDDLQALTYNLCHLFARCNRSVSYPAPTYYAHLVAARGKVYIENQRLNMHQLEREYRQRAIRENIIRRHPMYFI